MIENIRDAKIPSDGQRVWHYCRWWKFKDIFEQHGKLFFPTVALLRKSDPEEGSWVNFMVAEAVGSTPDSLKSILDWLIPRLTENASHQLAVNCWHVSDSESIKMWEEYVNDGEGIAIQTTFGRLKESFLFDHSEWPTCGGNFLNRKVALLIGQVEYVDWSNPPENTTTTRQVLFKDNSKYRHENELRITAQLFPIPGIPQSANNDFRPVDDEALGLSYAVLQQVKKTNGVFIPVDVNKLMESVYIAPNATPSIYEAVEDLIMRHNVSASIRKSSTL